MGTTTVVSAIPVTVVDAKLTKKNTGGVMPDADWLRTAETILKRVTLERDDLALRVDAKAQKLAVLDEEIAHYRAVLDSYNRLQERGPDAQ